MQIFKTASHKRRGLIIAVILTVQIIALCCISAAYAPDSSASSTPDSADTESVSLLVDSCTEKIGGSIYKASHSRGEWLYQLMEAAGTRISADRSDREGIFRDAMLHRIIGTDNASDPEAPVTRRFAAMTLVRALSYRERSIGYISDINSSESYMQTAAYYGYFIPDLDYRVYPDAELTDSEWDMLRTELGRYKALHGKRVLSFGDSIMYGSGNSGEGMSDMIAEKYGMTCSDYAIPGATMGVSEGRDHIPDQLRRAYAKKEQADIILINGGTNDFVRTALGSIRDSRDIKNTSETDFTGGFEKCMWMLRENWGNTPVVYIRVHDMKLGKQQNEEDYGDRALALAEKWGVTSVDLFHGTELNTDDLFMRERYTYRAPTPGAVYDAIHPTALGYAKYYLPLIGDAVWQVMNTEVKA